jgi:Cu-processing system ATP-binding protein
LRALLARVGLAGAAEKPVRAYSKGMRQRLGFAQALLGSPRVVSRRAHQWPGSGGHSRLLRHAPGAARAGVTIVITSHILAELQQRIDRLAIMGNGRILAVGSVAELRRQLDLPVTLALRVERGARAALWQHFAPLRAQGVELENGRAEHELILRCRRSLKMQVLAALHPMGGRLLDLQIQEPTLEDVFFGLKEAA